MRPPVGWFALLCALIVCYPAPAASGVADYPFRLVTHGAGGDHQIVAENNGPAPITVHATLTGQNVATDRPWPVTVVVPPYTSLPLGRVYASDRSAADYGFDCRYSHHFGRLDAVHDASAVYRPPFEDGRGFEVSQAYGGKLTSHDNRAEMYSIDFAMPVGSAVAAARAGVVIDVTLHHREGGQDIGHIDKANSIAIIHDDGTVAEYAHLSPGPAIVAAGQRVTAGDLLGFSGSTGYSAGPHLHFMVSRPTVNDGKVSHVSVPVPFYANDPVVRFSAQKGMTVWANHDATASGAQTARTGAASTATGRTSPEPLRGP